MVVLSCFQGWVSLRESHYDIINSIPRGVGINRRVLSTVVLVSLVLSVSGCGVSRPGPPVTVAQYERGSGDERTGYPDRTVLLHNLQRAMDPDLETHQRIDSLRLAGRLGGGNPEVLNQLAAALSAEDCPDSLRDELLGFLLRRDYPGMGQYVVRVLSHMHGRSPLREAVLDWLARHPGKVGLGVIVMLWADEDRDGADEPLFRRIVESIAGKVWDQGLLDALNSSGFSARGSAMEVLTARISTDMLRARIGGMTARTQSFSGMQFFSRRFNYLPTSARELFLTVWLHQTATDRLSSVAQLYEQWDREYGYRFDVCDFYLLSCLSQNSTRPRFRRSELVLRLAKEFEGRRHVSHRPSAVGAADDYVDLFATNVASLSMADLWNLYLLNEMLSQVKTQRALRVAAEQDRYDRTTAWGGLVRYENGQAVARLYAPDPDRRRDLRYVASPQLRMDSCDAICRFHAHFEKVYNERRAGPDAEDLHDAWKNRYYGLILTGINEFSFCAHYYNPRGIVVSLGQFRFRQ